ncbi:expressed protein [Phakopsora pachyrhizi]|uniref:Expressed protein n=1 Tax=Phakopsora pachyrhizi TaxID=170000 RepID=A0AAV0ALU1_PHAPC|nr:expressed protein [Phakopsora pachyrhizi]
MNLNILPEVPDLILNNIKYSSIDFFKHFSKSKESPISYSIQKFVLKDKKLKKYNFKNDFISNRTLISTYWYLYGAMDLSLRSLGDSNYKAKLFLNLLKGPGFVLNFQLARIDKDSKRLEESLSHALSNCAYCTGEEGLFLINLANQSGLNKTVTSKYLNRLTKHNDKVFSGVSNPFNLITFPTRIICCLSIFTFASFFL